MFVGSQASYQIQTLNGTSPISFSLTSGNLPTGTTLNSNGVISGTPTGAGPFSFTAQATDATNAVASRTISATVLTALTPPSGLVDWWPGDTNANDIVGNNNGTFTNGATYTSGGKVAGAFSFDGVDDYVDIPSMNIGITFSLEFWVFPTRTGLLEHLVSNTYAGSNFGQFYLISGQLYYYQGGSTRLSTPANSVALNTWSHVALTYDGAVARVYVNGTLQGTSGQHTMTFNNALRLGHDISNSSSGYFKGLLDEVSLYNRVLTADEILAIFNAGTNGKCKP
ncbi:MAG: putative Ig domain-containing protein [Acidobacteriia bacterium]|nr:putative Ig domain-containing protein [Terriglobia bacterium]